MPHDIPPDRPYERAYWVVPGKLMAGCYPGAADESEARVKLSRMLDLGIDHFVSLMERNELDHGGNPFRPYETMARALAHDRAPSLSFSRYPIRDMGVPSRETMIRILNDIDRAAAAGRVVYVHCWGGRGRTGTVVGCWLIRHGLAASDTVLERIDELRKVIPEGSRGPSPETPEQKNLVLGWRG